MEQQDTNYPLIIVFYFEKTLFETPEILHAVTKAVDESLKRKNANAVAYFLRCADGDKERIEVLNPIQIEKTEMEKINKLVEDIKKQFDIGQGADEDLDNPDNEVEICSCKEGEACSNCSGNTCECNNDEGCIYCNK